jgi:hypothetical protein
VLALGEALVEQFKLKPDDDVLGQWIAHYLAEKFTAHKKAKGRLKDALGAELVDIILMFWKQRAAFPRGEAPFTNYEAVLRALESFDPERSRFFIFSHANELVAKANPASQQLIELAMGVDRRTRSLIDFCFRYAAYASGKPSKPWIDAAKVLPMESDTNIVVRFVTSSEALDDSKKTPSAAELEIDDLQRVQRDISALIEHAIAIGSAIEGRIKFLMTPTQGKPASKPKRDSSQSKSRSPKANATKSKKSTAKQVKGEPVSVRKKKSTPRPSIT